MSRKLAGLAALFLVTRALTLFAYRDTYYSYGMIASQFAIAEAAYGGHAFSQDAVLASAAMDRAKVNRRFVPIEEWDSLERSGRYTTFPPQDLPGFGYLIATTSRWFGDRLTSRYALAIQVLSELASLLVFVSCVAAAYGQRTAVLTGVAYSLAYPFIWPIASLPIRDIFALGTFASFMGAWFVFLRTRELWSFVASGVLVAIGSVLLWIRPSGYYYGAGLALLTLFAGWRSVRARVGLMALLILVPWLTFGYPYRHFNLRHYGTEDPDFLGRVLWVHMGIIKDNPYGFVQRDDALVKWVRQHHGVDVDYGSPQMNRLLGDYAREVIRNDPGYFARTLLKRAFDMIRTPLDLVPPFPVAEFAGSGMRLPEYARAYPGSFTYRVLNRAALTVFFYGGLVLTLRLARTRRAHWLDLAVLMSPLAFTVAVQLPTAFEQRYMATGAWVLVLPWAHSLDEWRRRRLETFKMRG